MKEILKDIRFWIIIFFIIRLFGITNPPLEVSHNWRQTTVTMVSRNFLEIDNNILYPRIDIAGEKTGITGMEFPILNYLIYSVSEVFGYQDWYGRLINLIVSSLGLFFFYRLLKKYFNEKVSFYSTIILVVSIWFQFSRKVMPDTFAMSLIITSLYYGSNYLETKYAKKILHLILYSVLLMLGTLSKLPSAYILVLFAILFLNGNISIKRKLILSLVTIISLIPVFLWYFYWVPYLVQTYEFWHFFMGKSLVQGFNEIINHIPETLKRFYDTSLKFIGFGIFFFGIIYSIIKKDKIVFLIFLLSLFSFSIIIFKAGFTFYHHSYYIVPFVPIMAFVAGYGLSKINIKNLSLIILFAIVIEGIANQQHDFFIKDKDKYLINLETELDTVINRNSLILINSGNFPTPMYFSHRKGWINSNEKIINIDYINTLKKKGLNYILILKNSFGEEIKLKNYNIIKENDDFCLYEVNY